MREELGVDVPLRAKRPRLSKKAQNISVDSQTNTTTQIVESGRIVHEHPAQDTTTLQSDAGIPRNGKKYLQKNNLICFTLGTLTQIASVTENNDTGRNFAPVIPDDIGSETAVPTTLPMSSGVNEVVATSEKTMETRSTITADVTSVSMFFSATAASPSPQYNGNATRSSGTEFFAETF